MSTTERPELSKSNAYWVSRHRYYELRHLCLQYDELKRELAAADAQAYANPKNPRWGNSGKSFQNDLTEQCVEKRDRYIERVWAIEKAARETDDVIGKWIFKGVTTGMSYEIMRASEPIPCCKERYYELYRKFFWLLDQIRD